jgi:UDP-2,3-diacylglucosamine hydrolase
MTHPVASPSPPNQSTTTSPIGLIAGWGRFPILFAEKARERGVPVVCVGIRGLADRKAIEPLVKKFYWSRAAALNGPIRRFKQEGVTRWTMAGKVFKTSLFHPWALFTLMPDLAGIKFWFFRPRRDNRDDTLLLAFIEYYESHGLSCESALEFCPELLVREGILTKRSPTSEEMLDIRFGWEIAKQMGGLDIGQSIMVRKQAVLAVEAIEGTDEAILRAGVLCRRQGFSIIKVAKPDQDMRFDVPAVGPRTIETMRKAGAKVLAIEAGKTILLDELEAIRLADRYGISIVSLPHSPSEVPK